MNISTQDMIDFVGDRATPEMEAEIRKQFEDPSSFASRFIEEWSEAARTAYDVNWTRLAFGPDLQTIEPSNTNVSKTKSTEHADAETSVSSSFDQHLLDSTAIASTASPTPAGYVEPYREVIKKYLVQSQDDLLTELFAYSAGIRSSNPLSPYLKLLRKVICQDWNWPSKRSDPKFADLVTLALAVTDVLSPFSQEFPFPVTLIAATLVVSGLDNLCGCDSKPPTKNNNHQR